MPGVVISLEVGGLGGGVFQYHHDYTMVTFIVHNVVSLVTLRRKVVSVL